jgi:glutaredoxin
MAIRMYTSKWCGDCYRTKHFLEASGVEFEEVNIDEDAEAAKLVMKNNNGKRRVPTLEIDGAYYGNPPLPELAELIGNS